MTRQELLDVLKMPEEKQAEWLYEHRTTPSMEDEAVEYCFDGNIYRLAFELRDKAVKKGGYVWAAHQVRDFTDTDFMENAAPIEIIIASLIVLESEEK